MPALFRSRGRALPPRRSSRSRWPRRAAGRGLAWSLAALVLWLGSAPARPLVPDAARPSSVAVPAGGPVCGSTEERTLSVLAAHAAAQAVQPQSFPTTQSYDRGDIAVIEDDGTLLLTSGPNLEADEVA